MTTGRLRRSMNSGEFEAYIQPIVSASNLNVSGGELLARWHTPDGEIILPRCFINQIESAGLLPEMTCRLMQQAVDALSEIKNMLPEDFRLAVNVTPTLLVDRKFMHMCLMLAEESQIRLVLELTEQESFYMDWRTEWFLSLLNNAGVEISLDDFGTGCSVLSYLKYFPVRYIKIDKTFTQDIQREDMSRYIVESIVGLAERQSIFTVAEGVEHLEQADYLSSLGVNYLQGFYFGKPEKVSVFCNKYFNF